MIPLQFSHRTQTQMQSPPSCQPVASVVVNTGHSEDQNLPHRGQLDEYTAKVRDIEHESIPVVWRWVPLVDRTGMNNATNALAKPRVIYATGERTEARDPNKLPPLLSGDELREAREVLSRNKMEPLVGSTTSAPSTMGLRVPEVPPKIPRKVPFHSLQHDQQAHRVSMCSVSSAETATSSKSSGGAGGDLEVANLLLNMGGSSPGAKKSETEQTKKETFVSTKKTASQSTSKVPSKIAASQKPTLLEDKYIDKWVGGSVSLHTPEDDDVLSPLHCFMRRYCVEAFSATPEDVATPRYGKSHGFKIEVGQVGIRCIHCKHLPHRKRAERAVCFPSSLRNIYHSIETWQRRHSLVCKHITPWVSKSILQLMESSKTRAGGRRQYWEDSARRLGMVDTSQGVRFCRKPGDLGPIPSQESGRALGDPDAPGHVPKSVVREDDRDLVTEYLFLLMEQMETCRFTEEDRSGGRSKIKDNEVGFPGMQCRHCQGRAGFGRYFPSSVAALSLANSDRNVYNHLQKCRRCPESIKLQLNRHHEDQAQSKNRRGLRKLFFNRIWKRIHDDDANSKNGKEEESRKNIKQQQQQQQIRNVATPSLPYGPHLLVTKPPHELVPYAGFQRPMQGLPPPMVAHGHPYHHNVHPSVVVNNMRRF